MLHDRAGGRSGGLLLPRPLQDRRAAGQGRLPPTPWRGSCRSHRRTGSPCRRPAPLRSSSCHRVLVFCRLSSDILSPGCLYFTTDISTTGNVFHQAIPPGGGARPRTAPRPSGASTGSAAGCRACACTRNKRDIDNGCYTRPSASVAMCLGFSLIVAQS